MKKIKVLHYGLSENPGGIENVVFSWFKHKPDDVVFDFVSDCKAPLAYEKEFVEGGSRILHMEKRFEHPLKRYFSFKKIIEKNDYDFFHYHAMNNDEPGLIMICNRSNKTKPIIHCHSMYRAECIPFKEKILLTEFRILSFGQNYLKLSCSKEAGKAMFGNKDFFVIENGIDFDRFVYDEDKRKQIRKKYGIADDMKVIGHIGHECPEKNYPFIISVFSHLVKNDKNFRLLLVGNVDKSEWIKALIEKQEINEYVILTGETADVNSMYSAMDVYFFPSIAEGFGITLIEAQASGLPCVTSVAVTKDTKISDSIIYADFDYETVEKYLIDFSNRKISRDRVRFSKELSIKNTAGRLFDFYKENI